MEQCIEQLSEESCKINRIISSLRIFERHRNNIKDSVFVQPQERTLENTGQFEVSASNYINEASIDELEDLRRFFLDFYDRKIQECESELSKYQIVKK